MHSRSATGEKLEGLFAGRGFARKTTDGRYGRVICLLGRARSARERRRREFPLDLTGFLFIFMIKVGLVLMLIVG